MQPSPNKKWSSLLPLVVVLGLFVVCFSGVLFQDRLFAFRDAARFYYPLFTFIQQTWEAGQVPWWNPYENGGIPVWANPAASLFYPGKLIFFVIRDFDMAYRVYILGHVLLAAFWAYRLARCWHASRPAATLATIAYTFSGAVLIQYANVIFLVGAAWLPAGILAADRMLRYRRKRDAVLLGVVCALVTLGGDPQMAYHLGLLVLLLVVLRAIRRRALATGSTPSARRRGGLGKLLVISLFTGFLLAAIQIVPTVCYLSTTDRAESPVGLSVYDVPKMAREEDASERIVDGLLCRKLDQPGHQRSVYQFSVGPWRFAELIWPNCYGRQFPLHRRWIQVLPGEGRVWTPTLYAGILPLGFAIAAFRLRRGRRRGPKKAGALSRRWMSWMLLLGLVGSLGYYGIVWAVEEVVGVTPVAGAPVGGLYWLMTVLLPGYAYFRYPAKLLVFVSLGVAMLAARGWDDSFSARRVRTDRLFLGIMMLSLGTLAGFALLKPLWSDWVSTAPSCPLFGPLDVEGAFYETLFGLGQTAVVAGVAWVLLRWFVVRRKPNHAVGGWVAGLLVLWTVLDLGLANHWIIATAPSELWQTRSPIVADQSDGNEPPVRVYRWPNFHNPEWERHGSTDRLAEAVSWDCETLCPKYNLLQRTNVVNSYGTMMPAEYRQRLRGTPVEVMRATGATIAILPVEVVLPAGECLLVDEDAGFAIWRLKAIPKP
ncbi:MAG: YfhO family protein [Planctomycetia bacterium]|jgi:hypothetical protein